MQCLKCLKVIKPSTQARYGLHPVCFQEWFNVSEEEVFSGLQRRDSASLDSTDANTEQNTSFFHGKFKKYSANLLDNSYILKMRQDEAPELPEVEYLCNQIGAALDIPVAAFYYIDFYGDNIFVTKNFIRQDVPVDLQHIYHFRSENNHSCEGLVDTIISKAGRPSDVETFVRTLLFDALIGNHDRHGRNLAFIVTSAGTRLSPIYDNVSYLSLETGEMLRADFNPTGRINTQDTEEPSMQHYVKELKRLGFQKEIEMFYEKISTSPIHQLIEKSFCSPLMKSSINRLIAKQLKEIENEK